MASAHFPNLLYIYGPQSPSAFCNGPTCAWRDHVAELVGATLFPHAQSWFMGANIPGKKREMLVHLGGLPLYLQKCKASADAGYAGFVLS